MKLHHPGKTLTLSALTLALLTACGSPNHPTKTAPAAPVVSVAPAIHESVYDWAEFTGRLQAPQTVDLKPRVSGVITAVSFTEGSIVRAGDPLFRIDPRPFQAKVDELSAEVASARTQLGLAQRDLDRAVHLRKGNAMSAEELDKRRAARDQAESSLKALTASLQLARLDLSFTVVTAPITGRVSRALITPGNYVTAGQSTLTSLVDTDKVYAYFDADEQTYLAFQQHHGNGDGLPVYLRLADETGFPHRGYLDFVDNSVNPTTGTIRVRAVFDNHDGRFTPGLFAHLKLAVSDRYNAVLVSDRAVGTDLNTQYVLVVNQANKVSYRPVTLGARMAGLRVVKTGLADGERIVVNGLQRVHPGIQVQPENVPMANRDTLAELNREQAEVQASTDAKAAATRLALHDELRD